MSSDQQTEEIHLSYQENRSLPKPEFPKPPYKDNTGLEFDNYRQEVISESPDGTILYKYTLKDGLMYPLVLDKVQIKTGLFGIRADLGNGWMQSEKSWSLQDKRKDGNITVRSVVTKQVKGDAILHTASYSIVPTDYDLSFGRESIDAKQQITVIVGTNSGDDYDKDRKLELGVHVTSLVSGYKTGIVFGLDGELESIKLSRMPTTPINIDLTEQLMKEDPEDVGSKIAEELGEVDLFGKYVDLNDRERVRAIFQDTLGVRPKMEGPIKVKPLETLRASMRDIDGTPQDPRNLIVFDGNTVEADMRFLSR